MTKYLKFATPALKQALDLKPDYGLKNHGLVHLDRVYWNLPTAALVEEAIFRNEGNLVQGGPMLVYTGKWSARAAQDKYVVKEPSSEDNIWWGEYNRPMTSEAFSSLFARVQAYLEGEEVFVQDCYVGADPNYRLPIRIITEKAWQSHFARNQFITINNRDELKRHVPEFTLLTVSSFKVDPRIDGTRTDTAIVLDFSRRMGLVCNSQYGGEIKKSIFTVMNYLLPLQGVLSMHCSANVGDDGDVALFFGLSGTGKTTLSADPARRLIGDDEHGWSDSGIFNFEGGCYAKVIRLSAEAEPQIYKAIKQGSLLENVVVDGKSGEPDYDDASITENTRATYPVEHIPGCVIPGIGDHPRNIIFLTCDAFGVLPPIAKLTPEMAMYHFLSGYTAKLAGTEVGVDEPEATFSTCFGAPFMPLDPARYAKLLGERMSRHGTKCWLVNSGWSGGPYGEGHRMKIGLTRALLAAALGGQLEGAEFDPDPVFGVLVPRACPGVPSEVLAPKNTWRDKAAYDDKAGALAGRFRRNFEQYAAQAGERIVAAGPRA